MAHEHRNETDDDPQKPPRLVPAGSVNRVLLVGGKNLTMLQSVGLILIGLCFGVGGAAMVAAFGFASDALYLQLFALGLALWGVVMIVHGILGVLRRLRDATSAPQ